MCDHPGWRIHYIGICRDVAPQDDRHSAQRNCPLLSTPISTCQNETVDKWPYCRSKVCSTNLNPCQLMHKLELPCLEFVLVFGSCWYALSGLIYHPPIAHLPHKNLLQNVFCTPDAPPGVGRSLP
jgi:hypothetical protein